VLGKLLLALVIEMNTFLAIVPAVVLPLLVAGLKWKGIWLLVLGCANVVFFGLGLGLCSAVFLEEKKAALWSFLVVLPLAVLATPLSIFLPGGAPARVIALVQLFNPCEALAHVQTVTAGLRPAAFWSPLLASHLLAWALIGTGGKLLAPACRRQASRNSGGRARGWRPRWWKRSSSVALRTSLLDRNPFLWLTSRNGWATFQIWFFFGMIALFWGWLSWLCIVVRAINILIVMVVGLAGSWIALLLISVPAEACRRLAEDRHSGALEMLLCTPLPVECIVRGQWLALARRYLGPLLVTLCASLASMIAGYVTYGFGGMLDPEDRGVWLFAWLAGIGLLPLSLVALCWVSMRRALTARNVGDAAAIAVLQVVGGPCLALATIPMLLHSLFRWNLDGGWSRALFVGGFSASQIAFAWRARRILLRDLRLAAANRYLPPTQASDTGLSARKWWRLERASVLECGDGVDGVTE
jgi:hypothetical protein